MQIGKTDKAPLFAEVILPLKLSATLTYGVPLDLQERICIGMRVEVTLGKNKLYTAVVSELHNRRPEAFQVKPIKSLLDNEAVVLPAQLLLWKWVSKYYMSAIGEVMQAALPAHLKPQAQVMLAWSGRKPTEVEELSDTAFIAAEALQVKKEIALSTLREITGPDDYASVIEELIVHRLAVINDALQQAYIPKTEAWLVLNEDWKNEERQMALFDELNRAPKQLQVIMSFLSLAGNKGEVLKKTILHHADATAASLQKLINKGVFRIVEKQLDRVMYECPEQVSTFEFSPAQQKAWDELKKNVQANKVTLMQGVTGSGKTLLYIELIKQTLAEGKQVVYLVPEISLTTQLVRRLQQYFNHPIGVYHSKFSDNERVEIWEKLRKRKINLIVGARSALWLPFTDLGLIIVDEEHDSSLKQYEPAPRFHARDTAIALAGMMEPTKVVLGSATPAIETLYNAAQKKYGHVLLKERYQQTRLPHIQFIHAGTIDQLRSKGIRTLSPELLEAIQETLAQHKQVILFQNRRGYAPFQLCSVCGWIPQCKNCAVSLTYHRSTDNLRCHYCGLKAPPVSTCAACGSNRVYSKTFGTEKVEEEIRTLFPKARVARMDGDSMRGKHAVQQLLNDMDNQKVDILIGTQMVVKGLDFKQVQLVGILSADGLLSYPDYRVNERAFQLMEQVSGRAGRDEVQGKVFIQSYKLDHPVLEWVQKHDLEAYYSYEMQYRRVFLYPPVVRLIKVVVKHFQEPKASAAVRQLGEYLGQLKDISVHGPTPALIPRVRNQYIFELLIKLPKSKTVIEHVKQELLRMIEHVQHSRGFSGVQIIADVDPA